MTKAELVAQNESLSEQLASTQEELAASTETATALYEAASTLGDFNAALQKSLVDEQKKYEQLADQVHVLTLREKDAILVSTLRVKLILSLAKEIKELDQDLQHARMQIDAAKERADFWKKQYEGFLVQSTPHHYSLPNGGMRFGGHKH